MATYGLAIILPVRNRWHYTGPILQQLATMGAMTAPHRVIVVDDGSTDGTPERVAADFPAVALIRGEGDWWWTGAIAQGMAYALGQTDVDCLLWLNDDMQLPADFWEQALKVAAEAIAQGALIGGIVLNEQDWVIFSGLTGGKPIRNLAEFATDFVPAHTLNGNLIVLPKVIAQQLGPPDYQRFPHYGGDYEYSERAQRLGLPVLVARNLQGRANYTAADVVRYLPVWMQWWLASPGERWQLLWVMRSLKFNYNIWHIVNRIYIDRPQVPRWRYEWFYVKKVAQCVATLWRPKAELRAEIIAYCQNQEIPADLVAKVLDR
ncbi:glycosyltransferase [Spirulina sp. CCNP1310]|uniref:glycosyltransferase family 2 protein n=1 Tax=Spirulina sp. CCNP1310 TaxID=3110249 RepID=UPI002B21C72B|nr:glycosyltransferase [Spirulina sp. CCNP1310]MEA5419562.1 glycosyltransferase [Spirulina sp. CCNP1310]